MDNSKPVYDELVKSGVMDPSEVPFDESENEAPEIEKDEITLPHTIQLDDPFELQKGKPITEVVVRNVPTAGVTLHLPLSGSMLKLGHYVPIVAYALGESEVLVKKMSHRDYQRLVEVVSNFLISKGD